MFGIYLNRVARGDRHYRYSNRPIDSSQFPQSGERAQMTGTMNNARQLYLSQFSMANDGAATADVDSAYVGDYVPLLATVEAFVNKLVNKGYLQPGDVGKLLTGPSAPCVATNNNTTPPSVALTGTSALKVHPVQDADPANTIFWYELLELRV